MEPLIERNIPIPIPRSKWPFSKMEIGDSVFYDNVGYTSKQVSAATTHAREANKKFSIRREGSGLRFWRIL